MIPSVPVYDAVDRALFETVIVPSGRPALLRGLVADWPLVAEGPSPETLADRLRAAANDRPARLWVGEPDIEGRFFYSDDLRGLNHVQRDAPVAELLDLLLASRGTPHPSSIYAGGVPIDRHFPGLMAELPMPLLDPGMDRLTSLWIGNRVRTAAHWDLPRNLACVIAGRRRFTLFPTDQVANLYVGPVDFTLAGQPISLVDFQAPDFERFPWFRDALAHAEVAELGPGDALYMPSLWFHHVETLDDFGAMVNVWWREAAPWMTTPLFTLLHGLLTIRDLPEAERAAWKVFFDHYLFQTGGDPMAHIPPDARGVFGPMTPEIERRLKATIAGPLVR